jgi:hypothetical protein
MNITKNQILLFILLAALFVRVWGISFGLPGIEKKEALSCWESEQFNA